MASIKFSVHRNPKTNPDAPDTYHVRPDSYAIADRAEIVAHLQEHHHLSRVYTEPLLTELPRVIMEQLLENKTVHLQGLGTFSLRLAFRQHKGENPDAKPIFTDPADITGNEVLIDGINFRPDKEFLDLMTVRELHFENATGRGNVGHTTQYTIDEVRRYVSDYLTTHDHLTRRQLMQLLGLTKHMAWQWLERLTSEPNALLESEKVGTTFVYKMKPGTSHFPA